MPRSDARRVGVLLLALAASCAQAPVTAAILRAPPRSPLATRLTLPPLGQTRADRLADGDPVWVVRSADDQVFVLAADARVELGDRGWRVLVSYDPDCGCFRGAAPVVWGSDGAITAGTQPDYGRLFRGAALGVRRPFDDVTAFPLDRFRFTRDGESVAVGERRAATGSSSRERRPAATVVDTPGPHTRCAIATRPVGWTEGLSQPVGRVMLVAASLVFEEATPRLCPSHERACAVVTSTLHHDGVPAGRWVIPGPVVARRVGSGFADVVADASCATARVASGGLARR